MIVACEKCRTRFKLDEKRLTPSGAKLRCSKCQHTFEFTAPKTDPKPAPKSAPKAGAERKSKPAPPGEGDAGLLSRVKASMREKLAEDSGKALEPDASALPGPREGDPRASHIERAVEAALSIPDGPGGGDLNAAEGDGAHPGLAGGRAEDLFGASGAVEETTAPADVGARKQRSDDFDWDHISFTQDAAIGDRATTADPLPAGEPPLELQEDRPAKAAPAPRPAVASSAFEPASDALELDLGSSNGSAAGTTAPAQTRPAAGPRTRPAPEATERDRDEEPRPRGRAAKPAPRIAILPAPRFPVRPRRATLVLPRTPALYGSIALGLAVAVVSALTLYAPSGESAAPPRSARAVAGARPAGVLALEGLAARRMAREKAPPLLVVTGTARWSKPAAGAFRLEGVLVDSRGRSVERRPARLGPLPDLEEIGATETSPETALPPQGESSFLIFFTRGQDPGVGVRFEVRPGS